MKIGNLWLLFLTVLFFCSFFPSDRILIAGENPKQKDETFRLKFLKIDDLNTPKINANYLQLDNPDKKSSVLAVCLSIILPGMGELYANRFDVGKYSFIAEAGLWLTFAGIDKYGYLSQRDARSFARLHAGFDDNNKSNDYYSNIENFSNVYQYNDYRLRQRSLSSVYDVQSNMFWQWDSDANRLTYRNMRIRSDEIINNLKYVSITLIANRIISAINAARFVNQYNKSLSAFNNFDFSFGLLQKDSRYDGLSVNFSTSF